MGVGHGPGAHRIRAESGLQPQWPVYVVAAVGWSILAVLEIVHHHGTAGTLAHAGHRTDPATHGDVWAHGLGLLGMMAVMASLVARNIRDVALHTPVDNRGRVWGWVLGGWTVAWLPALAVIVVLVGWAPGGVWALPVATALAVAWQWSPRKRLSVARCHRVLAPPLDSSTGRVACRRYGWRLGWDCVGSCAPMMVMMMVGGHSVLIVASLTGLAWYERHRRPTDDPDRSTVAMLIAAVGVVAALPALATA